jgi:hypothetical protein
MLYVCVILQKLQQDFAKYLQHNVCDSVILCGDNGEYQHFNIIMENHDGKQTTKLGPLWNTFCQMNQFRASYTIRFKFSFNNYEVCHVFHLR